MDVTGGRTNNLYVRTNLTTNSISSRSKSYTTILEKVPINQPPNSFIYYYASQSRSRLRLNQKTISTIDIQITDDEGVLIDNNNVDFTLSLLFEVEYTPAMLPSGTAPRRLTDFRRNAPPPAWKEVGQTHAGMIHDKLR